MGLVGSNSWGSSDDMNNKYIRELIDYGTSQSEFIFNWGLLSGLERKEHDKKLEESYNKFKANPESVCIYRDPKKQEEFEAKKLDEERLGIFIERT